MNKWQQLARFVWALTRDVVFAGFGLWEIYVQTTHPGRYALELIGVAVALTVPSAAEHLKAILPTSAGESAVESSSRRSESHGSSPASESHGASIEPPGE